MSFYKFSDDDIINVTISTHPRIISALNGTVVTGSVYLERPYLNNALKNRIFQGFSQKEGGLVDKTGSLSASIDFQTAISGSTNSNLLHSLRNSTYPFYRIMSEDYVFSYTGSLSTTVRVINVPQIFYDREILTGSFTASDEDAAGTTRFIYDNGRGGLYSGSLTGTLVGSIFYSEGLVVITKGDLSAFGSVSPDNFQWKVEFNGVQNIPVKIFRCRAPAGQLNATTNTTFYINATSGSYKGFREIVSSSLSPYVTTIGLFNKQYELVAVAKTSQPIKKSINDDIMFKLKWDW